RSALCRVTCWWRPGGAVGLKSATVPCTSSFAACAPRSHCPESVSTCTQHAELDIRCGQKLLEKRFHLPALDILDLCHLSLWFYYVGLALVDGFCLSSEQGPRPNADPPRRAIPGSYGGDEK